MGAGLAVVAATGLAGASQVSAAPAAPSLPGSAVTPVLHARISGHSFKLTGDRSFPSNRVTVTLHAVGAERTLQIVKFKPGFTLSDLRADIRFFSQHGGDSGKPTKAAMRHLHDALRHTALFGGEDAEKGQTSTQTIVLPAGRYTFLDDTGQLPQRPRIVHVSANPTGVAAPAPASQATVTMQTNKRFGGSRTLPATGTITVTNQSTESPHFLLLQHVKNGTTRKQVERGLRSNGQPGFVLPGVGGTDALGMGKSETLRYSLPKGEYAEMCFFPDPKTGLPHAFMGMIRIVHLK
jgi:hypothetical protein